MRHETVYPGLKAGLAQCTQGALDSFNAIQKAIDTLDEGTMDKIWGEAGLEIPATFSLSEHQWKWHMYYGAGRHFADIDQIMYANAWPKEEIESGDEASAFLS